MSSIMYAFYCPITIIILMYYSVLETPELQRGFLTSGVYGTLLIIVAGTLHMEW